MKRVHHSLRLDIRYRPNIFDVYIILLVTKPVYDSVFGNASVRIIRNEFATRRTVTIVFEKTFELRLFHLINLININLINIKHSR